MARKVGLAPQDADDVVAEVLLVCVKTRPTFEHDRKRGFFRSWLKTIVRNKMHDLWRKTRREGTAPLENIPEPAAENSLWDAWDREYHRQIVAFALVAVREASIPSTWDCFEHHILNHRPAPDVAQELGLSVNAVYANASRVLKRHREKCTEFDEELGGE